MITSLVAVLLASSLCGNNASPTGIARMTVSKMRMADLESSASGYAYNQQGDLPVSYVQYTNHGSGRYYHAPSPAYYIVGNSAPVASIVPETASPHESVLLPYATAKHQIAASEPYPRGRFINYNAGQLAKYAQSLEPPKLLASALYYSPTVFGSSEVNGNSNRKINEEKIETSARDDESNTNNDDENGDDEEDEEEEEEEEEESEDYEIEDSDSYNIPEKADDFKAIHSIEKPFNNLRPDIDVSFEVGDGVKYSSEENSAHGEKGDKGYSNREEFNVGGREQYDKSRQQGHYNIETGNKKGYGNEVGDYGHYDEAKKGEKGSSYGQMSYHKKGQKVSGFHKVYHKDEYKKDTDFYDESHKKGNFDKYAVADEYHNVAEGDFKKGGHRESGFDYENSGKKNYYDQGYIQNRDEGYNKEKGKNSFHKNYENYSSDNDALLTKKHGYKKGDDHH